MAFTRVSGFLPSQSGFHFDNSWPAGTVYPGVTLPIVGAVAAGDATVADDDHASLGVGGQHRATQPERGGDVGAARG